jgi:hypothetical protein
MGETLVAVGRGVPLPAVVSVSFVGDNQRVRAIASAAMPRVIIPFLFIANSKFSNK